MPRAAKTHANAADRTAVSGLFIVLFVFLVSAWAPAAHAGRILVYGDSLSAAYGIAQERGWVALLAARLKREHSNYNVANASISGETTRGGLSRMKIVLEREKPTLTIIELGANDGLRGLPVAEMRRNLAEMFALTKAAGSRVLLVAVRMPPNYGEDYNKAFDAVFTDLAREHKAGLVPFFFAGFAEKRAFFQADNLHPTAAAQPILLDNVWKALKPML